MKILLHEKLFLYDQQLFDLAIKKSEEQENFEIERDKEEELIQTVYFYLNKPPKVYFKYIKIR